MACSTAHTTAEPCSTAGAEQIAVMSLLGTPARHQTLGGCTPLVPAPLLARVSSNDAASTSSRAAPCVRTLRRRRPSGASQAAPRRVASAAYGGGGGPYAPYPFHEHDYYRVALQMVQTSGPLGLGSNQGYLLIMRTSEDDSIEDPERALVMAVGGDTLAGVAQLAQGLPTGAAGGRPLSLDLLWQVLERGQEISKRTWGILRVAVVELRGSTFVGRVFFGDPSTGVVAWDCDCRPSDATWLALKSKAPMFIHRQVWEDSAMLLKEIQRSAEAQKQAEAHLREKTQEMVRLSGQLDADMAGGPVSDASTSTIMTTPRAADPEPLKRLKMEMRVALKDEDYTAAARIRDHPWMRLHLSCVRARQLGDDEEAERCERQLHAAISRHEQEEERQQAQRQRDAGGSAGGGRDRDLW